jgi:Membrane proteins related to metalloendopeptidases
MVKKLLNYTIKVVLLFAITTFIYFNGFAQEKKDSVIFRYPLNVKMSLSGNYGELRSNHFHNGIDFRVGGVVGAPIFAAEDGYISRIVVSPTGYGRGVYITHNKGFVTVYGHLDSFADNIRDYVLNKQYESEQFDQDLYFTDKEFPIKKGDFIGRAGNSGSSGGPHLHFEIRDSLNVPLNVFKRRFLHVRDNTPPIFYGVAFYGYNDDSRVAQRYYIGMELNENGFSSKYSKGNVVMLPYKSYVAIDAVDKMEGTPAKLAVEEYKVFIDNNLLFHYKVGEVPFNLGKYINSLLEYRQKAIRKRPFIKTYVEPGNLLKDRIKYVNNGLIVLEDTLKHTLKIEVLDYLKNKKSRIYTIQKDTSLFSNIIDTIVGDQVNWYVPNIISKNGLDVYIPAGALYSTMYLNIDSLAASKFLTPMYKVGDEVIPLHKQISLSFNCSLPDSYIGKQVIIKIEDDGNLGAVMANYNKDKKRVEGEVYSFGQYAVGVDLEPPTITSSIKENAVVKGDKIIFRVKDDLSGIKKYRAEIDGKWVLAEYDAKTKE